MTINELREEVKNRVENRWILPPEVRILIAETVTKQQKDKFKQVVIDEVTKTITDEIDAIFDVERGWQ